MAGRVPEHVIQQIVRSADIVRLAGTYCDLRKKGRNYWALCPFHQEKTASFSVDPENGLYYCFGCREGGNVFTLLEKLGGLSFGEALRQLAADAGIDISQYAAESGPSGDDLARLRELNELATSFYVKCLEKGRGGEIAREYLEGRRISPESIRRWRLGYAPDGWDHFLKCATGRRHPARLVEEAGLALPRQNSPGHYDRFRNRLMFPITDATARTIGFGARALAPGDEPKYLNSPETPLFDKGSCFFGLSEAREAIRKAKTAVVLEGYTDVIMAHQAGVAEAVAVLGTALTEDHARRLNRLCERVILVFDADEAGQKSAARSVEVLLNGDLEIRVAALPSGQDPCDYIVAHGGEEFRRRLDESREFWEFRLELAQETHGTDTIRAGMAAFRDVVEVALAVDDAATRGMIVKWVAHELGVRESDAWAYVEQRGRSARRARRDGSASPRSGAVPSPDEQWAAELLGLLLANPQLLRETAGRLSASDLPDCAEGEVLAAALEESGADELDAATFIGSMENARLAAAASGALAEERERERLITQSTLQQRLDGYLAFVEERRRAAAGPVPDDDDALREYERRLREKDRKSARAR